MVQRVSTASVRVDEAIVGKIGSGLLVYVAAAPDDTQTDVDYLADKVVNLRIFNDEAGKMNRSVLDVNGGVLAISAFTVLADARKGRRPSFEQSARGDVAQPLYDAFVAALRTRGVEVATGTFAAAMHVSSVNDGPICTLLDSRRLI